ncbi:MAG: protein-disulfide reductase DsbD [Sulfurovum sp.]|nr:protein-disulfide reductase DsbD [Sulfurovaceae bacterium]
MLLHLIRIFILFSTIMFGSGFNSIAKAPKFLQPEEAFKVLLTKDKNQIIVNIQLGDKIHIYEDSLHIKITKPKEFELLDLTKPKAELVDEEMIYIKDFKILIPLKSVENKISDDYTISVEFSGCSEAGICYQPQKRTFTLEAPPKKSNILDKIGALTVESNSLKIADVIEKENSMFIILLFFIFGLLLSLTPCIFPMIPILSSIIVSQSNDGKTSMGRAFFISLIYVLSMAVTYTIVGLIAGLLGADIQSAMQNPWVLTIFAGIFVALAFSLFGYYEIALPLSIQNKLTKVSDNAQSKGILGTAIMGFLSALIVGPCVAPPLGGAIIFISHSGDALLGGTALFVMSMGMGMPLLLVGIGAGKFMPRPGGWMTKISQIFGIMMLALAIFMLSRILPDNLTLILWAVLSIGISLYMGIGNGKLPSTALAYINKIFSILFMVYGISLFIGGISGSSSIIRPFSKFTNANGQVINQVLQRVSHKGYSIERVEKEVMASTKPVVIDFGKDSCTACVELEEITFPNPKVQEELKNFTFIKIDLTDNTEAEKALLKKYELFGTPNIIFFDKSNKYLADKTLTGFIKPDIFTEHLKSISK